MPYGHKNMFRESPSPCQQTFARTVHTRNTVAQVCGVAWVGQIWYRTCTRGTRLSGTAGLPVPVRNPKDLMRVCSHFTFFISSQQAVDSSDKHANQYPSQATMESILA